LGGLAGDVEILRIAVPHVLTQAAAKGALPPCARFTMFYPGPAAGQGVCKLAIDPDAINEEQVRDYAMRVAHRLTREVPGCADAVILEQSPRPLARNGRRLLGRRILCEQDVLTPNRCPSDAAHAWWPIELWDVSQGPIFTYAPTAGPYDISHDALCSQRVMNLCAAGACLSATALAAASARAGGICLATGDAAGRIAAAMAAGTRS